MCLIFSFTKWELKLKLAWYEYFERFIELEENCIYASFMEFEGIYECRLLNRYVQMYKTSEYVETRTN